MLEPSDLSPGVRELLQGVIHSFETLDLLLLLQRDRGCAWSSEQLARESQLPREVVGEALAALLRNGLVVRGAPGGDTFAYQPRDPQLAQHVCELVELCLQHRLDVLLLISSQAIGRVREGALRAFADALGRSPRKRDE